MACFHYRTLLVIPDIDRSPFPIAGQKGEPCPKSLLFVPMMAQSEVVGVLELDQDDRVRDFTADEQALAQHLGNQIGVAIRLLDQRTVQEQLFRTEKMAAVGRLISGVVNELQTPLASITDLATRALEKARGGAAEREVAAIATEAAKASGMVSRMVSFAAAEQVEARAVDVAAILRNLIEFREGDWKASGIRVRDLTSRDPLFVHGSPGPDRAGLPESAGARRTIAGRFACEIDYGAHQPAGQAPAGGDFLHLALGVAQAGGYGGSARRDAQRDRRAWRRSPFDREEQFGPALRSGTAGADQGPLAAGCIGQRGGARLFAPPDGPGDRARRDHAAGSCWPCCTATGIAWFR